MTVTEHASSTQIRPTQIGPTQIGGGNAHHAEAVQEVALASHPRMPDDAMSVLLALGSAPYPLTRRDLSDRVGVAVSTLSRPMVFLESHGFIVSTRRYGTVLGTRFLDHPELSRNLRDSVLALARPHLEYFAHRHDGIATLSLSTEDSVVIAETVGTPPPGFDRQAFQAALTGVLHAPRDGTAAALALRGVWAGAAGEDVVAIGSRVRFTGSAAILGIAIRTPNVAQFSELSLSVLTEANMLTSALRRVYPNRSRSRV